MIVTVVGKMAKSIVCFCGIPVLGEGGNKQQDCDAECCVCCRRVARSQARLLVLENKAIVARDLKSHLEQQGARLACSRPQALHCTAADSHSAGRLEVGSETAESVNET
jgi:hypothetical protein